MKKIKVLITTLLALLSVTLPAQNKNQDNKSLLWRISGKKLTTPSYLFGTIHLICPEDYLWTEKMKETFSKSDKVCFEMDLDDPSLMGQVAAGMVDNSGKKLADYFTPEQYTLLKNFIRDSMGMDMSMLENMKPVMLESIISTGGSACAEPVSYEETLMKTAQEQNKEIIGLETAAEQLDVLNSIPTDTVIKALLDELQRHDNNDAEFVQLTTAYKNQDLQALYKLLVDSKDMGADMGKFLDDRNKKWIPKISGIMQTSSVFFAVGAGHLWGEQGVITLLRNNGYKVEPLK